LVNVIVSRNDKISHCCYCKHCDTETLVLCWITNGTNNSGSEDFTNLRKCQQVCTWLKLNF